jgi:hypothetical protein
MSYTSRTPKLQNASGDNWGAAETTTESCEFRQTEPLESTGRKQVLVLHHVNRRYLGPIYLSSNKNKSERNVTTKTADGLGPAQGQAAGAIRMKNRAGSFFFY